MPLLEYIHDPIAQDIIHNGATFQVSKHMPVFKGRPFQVVLVSDSICHMLETIWLKNDESTGNTTYLGLHGYFTSFIA